MLDRLFNPGCAGEQAESWPCALLIEAIAGGASGMNSLRRILFFIAYFSGAVLSFLLAFALANGITFIPSRAGRRYGPPSPWQVVEINSPFGQTVGVLILVVAGLWLFSKAYKMTRQTRRRKHRE
jgi:hypothetical protein